MTNPQSKHYDSGRKGASHRTNYAGRRKTPASRTPGKVRQPEELLNKIRKKDKTEPVTAQQSIPYLEMSPDGICRLDKNT